MTFMVLALATIPASVALAQVAPQYMDSEPADGAEMHKAPDTVTVTFSEPLDESSKMIVKDHCGNRLDDGRVTVSLNELSVGIKDKPAGHYMVTYAAVGLGGITGTTQGTFSFKVHAGTGCDGGAGHDHHGGTGMDHSDHDDHTGGSDHSGHSGGAGHQAGSGHEHTTDHSGGAHTDHGTAPGSDHSDHAPGGDAEHQGHHDAVAEVERKKERLTQLATGGSPYPGLGPDSEAVLMSLGLAAAFGLMGGWILRTSSRT
jgi:methionine-rich copper-binding protein CopC